MSTFAQSDAQSCVLIRLGERRFALDAHCVIELVAPSRVFRFPHKTPGIEGVILRRGRIIPVCDFSEQLLGKRLHSRRFYLIANRRPDLSVDWIAIPVTGECELISADFTPASESDSPHVAAWLSHNGEIIEVLALEALVPSIDSSVSAMPPAAVEAHP